MAIKHYIDGVPHYLAGREIYTESEWQAIKKGIADNDEHNGYNDRMAGYYDKWYRYNRADNGAAYDKGVQRATQNKHCPEQMQIIEIAQ